jgi:hypothetical protein
MPDGIGNYPKRAGGLARSVHSAEMLPPESKAGCGDLLMPTTPEVARIDLMNGRIA